MNRPHRYKLIELAIALGLFGAALPVNAQTATPFELVGHVESFCLSNQILPVGGACLTTADKEALAAEDVPVGTSTNPRLVRLANPLIGARIVANGIAVTIPTNLVVQMPAAYLTPQQLFDQAQGVSRRYNESGLALDDKFPPLAAFEVAISGNIVCLPPSTTPCTDTYIAGLVSITQQSLNTSAGFIHGIDTTNGMMCVGASPTLVACGLGDTRIRLNDPVLDPPDPFAGDGRYGNPNPAAPPIGADNPNSRYPDPRFQVDQDNPTIHALTGYPMCVPRNNPDPKCPAGNRLAGQTTFIMDTAPFTSLPPALGPGIILPCGVCNPLEQAPFIIGDYVIFAGTLAQDGAGRFVSVHTMVANVGIYTKPGNGNTAYVTLDESLLGTKGNLVLCGSTAECQDRIKIEGFITDPTRIVSIYAVDVVPDGVSTVRKLNSTAKDQAVWGRFRYITGKNAGVVFDSSANLKGLTRELMARIDDGGPLANGSPVPELPKAAHGLTAGIYVAPVGEYIFPEPTGIQGGSLPELNFQCLAFLVNGWALPGLPNIPQLAPWPGVTPTFSCSN